MRYALLAFCVACGTVGSEVTLPALNVVAPAKAGAVEATGSRTDVGLDSLESAMAAGAPVIDVRTPAEFAAGHVEGAVNVPLGFSVDDPALASLDKGEPVYLICQSGGRSGRAADQLAAAGYQAVNIKGGTGAWIASGRPVAK